MSSGFARMLCTIALTFLLLGPAHGQSSRPLVTDLQLRIIVLTPTVKSGEPLKVRIELKNDGKDEVVVARNLVGPTNGPAYLALEFEDENGKKYEEPALLAWMSLEHRNDWWTQIAPGHYYGVENSLDDASCECLKKPGRYKLVARYISKGGLTPPSREDWYIPAREVWKGEIVSNSVAFEVLPAKDGHAGNQ
jgi:ribosomal protein S28E/S33